MYNQQKALALLQAGTGCAHATFRDGQEEAIRHIVEGHNRLLVVQKTGWGKSFVYFIAAKLLREAGLGPTLLISPLLALMRNQVDAARRMGVCADTIHSGNQSDWEHIEERLRRHEIDILLISPERLANDTFRDRVLSRIIAHVPLLVIDEAHCISDWGHDFRPDYQRIKRIISHAPNLRLLATTATANNRVMDDLTTILGPNLHISRGDLNRPALTLQTIRLSGQAERLAWLAEQLTTLPGSGIIYALTIRDATQVAEWLGAHGFNVAAYTSATKERPQLEQALLDNRLKALVATTALGMGYDKPDLSFVIHYQTPGSVVAYYQQVGRAGRAIKIAYGVLLSGNEDTDINDWFISNAFPTRREVDTLLTALDKAPDGLSIPRLCEHVNIRQARIKQILSLLALESPAPVVKQDTRWQLAPVRISDAFWQRVERLTAIRKDEQQQMQDYVQLPFGAHMRFLVNALDGDVHSATMPTLPPLPDTVEEHRVAEAVAFLQQTSPIILPRKKRSSEQGLIPTARRAQAGKALCQRQDSGWGQLVEVGKYRDNYFSNELVAACVRLVHEWKPTPAPTWVACVPSLRYPDLVPCFAIRLAEALKLPFHAAIINHAARPPQAAMANSVQKARNAYQAFSITPPLPSGPVLLIDDMVDSRWTITACSYLLREHASGPVWPLALAAHP